MGQKVHPIGFRIGVIRDTESKWYLPKRGFADAVYEDYKIRRYIKKHKILANAAISRVEIERGGNRVKATLHRQTRYHHRAAGAGRGQPQSRTGKTDARSRYMFRSTKSGSRTRTRSWLPKASRSRSKSVLRTSAPCARRFFAP